MGGQQLRSGAGNTLEPLHVTRECYPHTLTSSSTHQRPCFRSPSSAHLHSPTISNNLHSVVTHYSPDQPVYWHILPFTFIRLSLPLQRLTSAFVQGKMVSPVTPQPLLPSTPPRRSARLPHGLSPPASPATTHRSTDDHLESSYLFINESDETSSEIGSSLRDSVIGDLSDSSSEAPIGREGWEDDDFTVNTDRQSDEHGELVRIENELGSEGSYIDAEATASDLGGSRSTVQHNLLDLSDSQIRLIMPDPGSSFTTSATVSDNTTPSGSLGSLLSTAERGERDVKPMTIRRILLQLSVPSTRAGWKRAVDYGTSRRISSQLWSLRPRRSQTTNCWRARKMSRSRCFCRTKWSL